MVSRSCSNIQLLCSGDWWCCSHSRHPWSECDTLGFTTCISWMGSKAVDLRDGLRCHHAVNIEMASNRNVTVTYLHFFDGFDGFYSYPPNSCIDSCMVWMGLRRMVLVGCKIHGHPYVNPGKRSICCLLSVTHLYTLFASKRIQSIASFWISQNFSKFN